MEYVIIIALAFIAGVVFLASKKKKTEKPTDFIEQDNSKEEFKIESEVKEEKVLIKQEEKINETPVKQSKSSLPQDNTIMVIDDSKVIRIKLEKFLKENGYKVETAIDGIDALEKLDKLNKPNLIITDIEMPNMDGFGLIKNVRSNPLFKEIPIIIMSSHADLHLDISIEHPVNGFVGKPYDEKNLLEQIEFLTK